MSHQATCDRFLAALGIGDFETMGALMQPDFVVHEPAGLPYAGDFHGLDGWRELSSQIVAAWAGFKLLRKEFYGETADTLVVMLFLKGRSRKTGKRFETSVLELWRFREGRICEITPHYWDTHTLAALNS